MKKAQAKNRPAGQRVVQAQADDLDVAQALSALESALAKAGESVRLIHGKYKSARALVDHEVAAHAETTETLGAELADAVADHAADVARLETAAKDVAIRHAAEVAELAAAKADALSTLRKVKAQLA